MAKYTGYHGKPDKHIKINDKTSLFIRYFEKDPFYKVKEMEDLDIEDAKFYWSETGVVDAIKIKGQYGMYICYKCKNGFFFDMYAFD